MDEAKRENRHRTGRRISELRSNMLAEDGSIEVRSGVGKEEQGKGDYMEAHGS